MMSLQLSPLSATPSLFPSLPSHIHHTLNTPVIFPKRRRRVKLTRRHTTRFNSKSFAVAALGNGASASRELPKTFDFASEERIYKWWESQGYFKPKIDSGTDPFVVPMPPPNVTGSLHMGHAMFVTLEGWSYGTPHLGSFLSSLWCLLGPFAPVISQQLSNYKYISYMKSLLSIEYTFLSALAKDIMVRYHRMKGRPTLWLPGTDHAGIATQLVVERMLAAEGIRRTDLGRDEFTKRAWLWKEMYGGTITNQIRRLGASCDWTREHFTLDEQPSRAVVEAFIRLHEKGLIYRGSYMVNWSPSLQTAVSDLEVEYSEETGTLYYIKYRVAGGSRDDWLTIATTRPETLFGDVAVAVHPMDERYAKYIGRMAIVPMTYGRHIPIISDKHVDKDFGTGVLKISPGHDQNDYLLARKLGLPILNVMNKDGTLNDVAGLYSGLDRFEARKKLWSDLEETGLAVKREPHTLRVPRSQRGGEVIEPLISKQWFVSMEPLAEKALLAAEKGELRILPERFEKIYNHWLSNIKDWCISRQLWWGHRIPVWYVVGNDSEEDYIIAKNAEEALDKARIKYGKDVEIYQDPDVLDTWFSSSLWPFSTLGWPDVLTEDFQNFYPATVLETGHDILFFWVARMVMMGIEFTGTVPFSYVYLHGLIRDSEGRKMSKTLGNVIDPIDTIKEFGTDALRFTLALGTAGQDLNLSTDRLSSNKAFTNKLWNAGKFVLQNLPSQSDEPSWENILACKFDDEDFLLSLPVPECWVVSKLHLLVDGVTTAYDKFHFGDVGRDLYEFFWGDFADWYIEASKERLYNSKGHPVASVAQAVLLYVFENILKLLHPFMPFVTEELWLALPRRKEALMVSSWPQSSLPRHVSSMKKFENLQALTKAIRNARAEYSVEPAKRISASIVASIDVIQYISTEREVLALLSRLDSDNINIMDSIPGDAKESVHIVAGDGLEAYLPLVDMVDISAEVQRLSKRLIKMQGEYDGLAARLSSPKFVEKAPDDVVQGVQEKARELEEKLTLIKNRLNILKSTVLVSQ